MFNKLLLVFIFFCMLLGAAAQDKQRLPAWKFQSHNAFGLLNGQQHTASHFQSVNGFRIKNLFMGIGVGLDYYQYRSIPVFADVRKYFGRQKNQFFVYADGGPHFVWDKTKDDFALSAKFIPQVYSNLGMGYQLRFKDGSGFLLSAGYTYKSVKYQQKLYSFCPFNGPCELQEQTYKYDFNRVIIQIGLIF